MVMVRPAVSADIEQIARMDSSAQVDQSRRAFVQSAVDRAECFVAVDNGILAGYGVMNYAFFAALCFWCMSTQPSVAAVWAVTFLMNSSASAGVVAFLLPRTCPIFRCKDSWPQGDMS